MGDELENSRISFLNVGTKILLKDTMDQFIRSLGDYKTFYSPTMSSALRTFQDNTIHVLMTEVSLEDGSAFRLIRSLGWTEGDDDLYIILALEERSDALLALASELEVHSVIVKPFAAHDLKAQIERYKAWRTLPKEPWQVLLREARHAEREKKYREAEENYKEAIKSAPANPIPIYKAGAYYLKKPDYAIAEMLFLKAIALKPDYTQAISRLGALYLTKRELDKAEERFERAQKLSPLNPDRLLEMVRLYLDRSVEACRESLKIDVANTAARVQLGKMMSLQKDYVGGIRELERSATELKDESKIEAQTFAALCRKLGGLAR